jgi:hypothetical protein
LSIAPYIIQHFHNTAVRDIKARLGVSDMISFCFSSREKSI